MGIAEPAPVEEVKEAPPVKSGSGQSELVFYPDPDFLLKINQNIRTNNERLETDQPEEDEDDEAFAEPGYERVKQKPAAEERQEIISCGSDVEVVEADEDEALAKAAEHVRKDEPRRTGAVVATDSVLAPADENNEQANGLQSAYLQQHANTDRN